jgi:hypothetical protein
MTELLNAIFSSGVLLDTEHGLVMLLLLYGLLTYRGPGLKWVPVVIVGGILLSLFTPVHEIDLLWPAATALIVPPFLWQGAVAVTKSGPLRSRPGLLVWSATLLLISLSLWFFGGLAVSNALILGILAVTLVWYFRELEVERSYLSTVGLITLVVLLVEIDLALYSWQIWLGTLASGIAIGLAVGFLGVYLLRKAKSFKWRNAFFFAGAYAAYLTGLLFETSAITTTLASALVISTYGLSTGLWERRKDIPVPSSFLFFFLLGSAIWILLGWQAHTSLTPASLYGILPALAVIAISILILRKLAPVSSENRWIRLIRKETGVFLLLLGSILFWPQQAFLSTLSVEIALVTAALLIILLRKAINPLLDLIGVDHNWSEIE